MINKNGFAFPLHPFQILSWVIFLTHTLVPVLLIYPHLNLSRFIPFLILFYSFHTTVLITAYQATKSNPSIKVSKDPIYNEGSDNLNFYCTICESYVTRTSKHCGSCDRCVDGFDHHCKWLNNCIGRVNYRLFITLICTLEVSEVILLSFEVFCLSLNQDEVSQGLLILDCILNCGILLLVGYLISIHIWLKVKGISTYEYIKAKRKLKENRVNPGRVETEENKNIESKSLSKSREVKKSIIKSTTNRSVIVENPRSFSISKEMNTAYPGHMTLQIRSETGNESDGQIFNND